MNVFDRLLCRHDFRSRSLRADTETLVKECQNCGKRVEERLSPERSVET
jgi:hypothetical protein